MISRPVYKSTNNFARRNITIILYTLTLTFSMCQIFVTTNKRIFIVPLISYENMSSR